MTTSSRTRQGCSPWTMTGCGCGLLAMLGISLVFILLSVQVMRERRDPAWSRAKYGACMQNLGYLGAAIVSYEKDHPGPPPSLTDLAPRYINSTDCLHCPLAAEGRGRPYQYTPQAGQPTDALITCPNHRQGPLILQQNGKVRWPDNRGGWTRGPQKKTGRQR